MNTSEKGRAGEEVACKYLSAQGYRILERNYRWRGGELDIVAQDDSGLIVSEVKCWDHFDLSELSRSIDRRKRSRIIATTRRYLASHRSAQELSIRFDVVFVRRTDGVVHHIRGAFAEA